MIKKLPIDPPRWDMYNGKCDYEDYEEIYNESLEQSNWEFKLAQVIYFAKVRFIQNSK